MNPENDEVEPRDDRNPQLLFGMCKDLVPEDFDVEAAIREIRSEWLKELDAISQDAETAIP